MAEAIKYRFDPVDHRFMRLRGQLSPGERLQAMLAARRDSVDGRRHAFPAHAGLPQPLT